MLVFYHYFSIRVVELEANPINNGLINENLYVTFVIVDCPVFRMLQLFDPVLACSLFCCGGFNNLTTYDEPILVLDLVTIVVTDWTISFLGLLIGALASSLLLNDQFGI